jgi:hypothetical protein
MNEEYIKKLEADNKRLEETLAEYIDRYGELKPIVSFPVEVNPSETVTFGNLSGMNIAQITSGSNVTFKCNDTVVGDFLSKEYFDEWRKTFSKQQAELRALLKPKQSWILRYLRVKFKKIKRIFK